MASRKNLLLQEYTERYGLTMDVRNLADIFHMTSGTIRNLISSERLPFDTFTIRGIGGKKGKRLAHTKDVVNYIEGRNSLG